MDYSAKLKYQGSMASLSSHNDYVPRSSAPVLQSHKSYTRSAQRSSRPSNYIKTSNYNSTFGNQTNNKKEREFLQSARLTDEEYKLFKEF